MSVITELEARGEARGRHEALVTTLAKLLGVRFAALPDDVHARIRAADDATLDRWLERVVSAPSLEAVLAD